MSADDPCDMPVGNARCYLPGDHTGPCRARTLCLCSHAATSHTRGKGHCWLGTCFCQRYRPNSPATTAHIATSQEQQ